MKRFLKLLGIWFAVLILLATATDYIVSSGLRKTTIRKFAVWNDIYASKINSDVLIMGSSETWCGYNTYVIDSLLHCDSYNIAMDGHSIRYQLIRYNTYRRYCPKPEVVIVNLDFPGSLDYDDSPYEREQFFPFNCDDSLIDLVSKDMKITLFDRYFPSYRYFGNRQMIEDGFGSFFGKKSFKDDGLYKGFRGNDYEWSSGSLYLDELFEAPIDADVVDMLNDFVLERKKEGIKIVLVEFPEYYRLRNKFTNIPKIESTFNRIAEEHQIPLLDYSQFEICYDSTCYYNPSHLNSKGAEQFTIKLCQDIDSLKILGL